jgi:hypothetical protein
VNFLHIILKWGIHWPYITMLDILIPTYVNVHLFHIILIVLNGYDCIQTVVSSNGTQIYPQPIRGRCYDFENIFAKKLAKKLAFLT